MKLQQLLYIWEVSRHDLNISSTAQSLYTSQPGISKQIRLLEDELGVEIFARSGKHLTYVTPAGEVILEIASDVLRQVNKIKQIAQEFNNERKGSFSIATTHNQARYVLPEIVSQFIERYPDVSLNMHQGSPIQVAELAAEGSVDFVVSSEALDLFSDLVVMPCYKWNRAIIVPKSHPLTQLSRLTLSDLAANDLITYIYGVTGRSRIDETFMNAGLEPKIVFTASDADVIKTYVRLGLGVGIISSMSFKPEDDDDLVMIPADHLFEPSITKIGCRRGTFIRGFMLEFLQVFAPHLTEEVVTRSFNASSRLEVEQIFQNIELPSR